ncbi:hypothetical protein BCEP27_31127 [Burkholderia cepacia]
MWRLPPLNTSGTRRIEGERQIRVGVPFYPSSNPGLALAIKLMIF